MRTDNIKRQYFINNNYKGLKRGKRIMLTRKEAKPLINNGVLLPFRVAVRQELVKPANDIGFVKEELEATGKKIKRTKKSSRRKKE